MVADLAVDVDLEFSVDIPGSRTVTGSLTGSGKTLELRVSNPVLFGGRADAGAIRGLAAALARRGLSVHVFSPSGKLVTLGAPRTSFLQRLMTGSPHIRIERAAALRSLIRGRVHSRDGALPAAELAPPSTPIPFAPTMARRPARRVTTTHDPDRGGRPRLILALGPYPIAGERPSVFMLNDGVTTIGAGADCDISLPGLEPLHAVIRHDDEDEFVLEQIGSTVAARVHGAPVHSAILRTGCGVDLGEWHLSFFREEYADHGRPFGGRIGGELSRQQLQPGRASVQRPGEVSP